MKEYAKSRAVIDSSDSGSLMSAQQTSDSESVMSDPQSSVSESVQPRDNIEQLTPVTRSDLKKQCLRRLKNLTGQTKLSRWECQDIKNRLNKRWILDGVTESERLDIINAESKFNSGEFFYRCLEYHIKHAVYQEFYEDFLSVTEQSKRGR